MTILCLCPQFAGPVGCFREEVRFPAGGGVGPVKLFYSRVGSCSSQRVPRWNGDYKAFPTFWCSGLVLPLGEIPEGPALDQQGQPTG